MNYNTLKMSAIALVFAISGSIQAALTYNFTISNTTQETSHPILLDFQQKKGVKLAPKGVKPGETLKQSYTAHFGTGKSAGTADAYGCLMRVYEVGTERIFIDSNVSDTWSPSDICQLDWEIEIIPLEGGTTAQGTAPQATTPQEAAAGTTPQATVPQATAPQATEPQEAGTTPQATEPQEAGTVPQGTVGQ